MMRRLRIVHVTGCLDMGGQEKLLVEFAKHADRDRFELRFLSLEKRGILAEEIEAQGWPVETLDVAPGLHLRLPLRLAKLFRAWRPDVIHTHNERPLLYGAPAARMARVPGVIHTKHGRGAGNSRRQNWLIGLAARLVDPFVCVSEDSARLAAEQGAPESRIRTLHNGIDRRRFEFHGPTLDGPAVVVARLCPEKDIATLLRAAALVVRDVPDFRLAIAGDGPDLHELRQLVANLGIAAQVSFLGMVRDVPALLRQARMFVLSSVSEGVPLTLLEAMASGLPCVATRVGGMAEVIDETSGLLVPPRDPQSLATALLRLHRDDDLACSIGRVARSRIEEHFDVRQMVAQYERMYESACGFERACDPGAKRQTVETEVQGCASHI